MRFWRAIFALGVCVLVVLWSLFIPNAAVATSSPWSQTDWSGGSGQSAFSNTTKYSSGGNIISATANQITLSNQNVGNLGTGTDGAITVAVDKNINTDNMITGRSCSDGGDAVNYSVTSSVSSGASSITLSSTPASGCLVSGDEILIINLEGTGSDNSTVGKYETATIQSISTATITLSGTLSNSYDGTTQKIMVQRVPNYTNVTISSGKTLTASAWNGTKGGVLFFRATGTVTVTGTISANAIGFRGGTNNANGESYDGSVGTGGATGAAGTNGGGSGSGSSSLPVAGTRGGGGAGGATDAGDQGSGGGAGGGYGGGGGGGGGGNDCSGTAGNGGTGGGTNVVAGGGGGGGGYSGSCGNAGAGGNAGNAGTNASNTGLGGAAAVSLGATGQGGSGGNGDGPGGLGGVGAGGGGGGGIYGSSTLSSLFFGSGGGGGNNSGNNGQNGGGIISISANTLTNSGSITSNGANATSTSSGQGAGGAGAGGSILISANTLTLGSSTVTASGGSRSTSSSDGGGGGGGGVGRIAAYSANTISGTSSPTYATTSPSYNTSGTLTSSIFDTGFTSVNWGTVTFVATTPTNTSVTVKVRSGNQPDLSDATAFSSCSSVSSGSSLTGNSCLNTSSEYVQYQVTFSTSDTSSTPTFTSFSLSFSQPPSTATGSTPSNGPCLAVTSIAPNLYEVDPSTSSMTLYFTPISNADAYSISYGPTTAANTYATNLSTTEHTGAVQYTINSLSRNTTYYFRVQGRNNCSTSNWSNTMASTTKSSSSSNIANDVTDTVANAFTPTKKLDIVSSKLTETLPTSGQVSPTPVVTPSSGVSLDVKVLGTDNKPLAGVNVTLHSNVQTAKTDAQGIAHFVNVEKGQHHVLLAYNGYAGQQSLTVDGSKKAQTLTMQVRLTQGAPWGVFAGVVIALVGIIGILLFIVFRHRKVSSS